MVETMNEPDSPSAKSSECNSEQDDDSSTADEIEPKLRYDRLSNDLKNILQNDAVSCVAYHSNFICIGTKWGTVRILDHEGNKTEINLLRKHAVAVNQISIDKKGEFIATCSDDGKAFVYALYSDEHTQELSIDRSIKSIAIDPLYYKLGPHRRFVTGDDRLTLHEKTFLSRVKSTELQEAIGRVQNIKWCDRFIAWACDVGVRVYDIVGRTSIVLIKWKRDEYLIPEKFPCSLTWKDNLTLLIGWVDTVRVCKIEKRNSCIKEIPEFSVIPETTFQIEYLISGVCPLDSSQLVILAYVKEKDEQGKSLRPLMHILQAEGGKYKEICTDNLSVKGYQDYSCNDYHLECLVDENRYIIASPKDLIIANIYEDDDRIEWLVQHKKFEEAMELVMNNEFLQRNDPVKVGKKYVDHLLSAEKYVEAAEVCSKVLGIDKDLWEEEAFKFTRCHHLRAIIKYLPTAPGCRLNPHIYEMALYEYLKLEPKNFLKIVKELSPELYNVHAVMNAVLEHIVNNKDFENIFLESLAILYTYSHQYDKALNMYLKLKHKDVFQLMREHNLYNSIKDDINQLMELDAVQAINMFLEQKWLSSDVIVERLERNQYHLFMYLDALDAIDHKSSSSKYHAQLVKLYANFAPQKLLPLLRRSVNYPIQEILSICKEKNLHNETVYLLDKIGNTKQALQLLIENVGDMEQAITFCKEHNDPELWEELVRHSLSKPEYVTYLLQKIGTYVDPRILISRLDEKMHIPGLKKALVKMLRDYSLQVSVQEGCKNIVVSDCFNLHDRLVKMQQRGLSVDDDLFCNVCHQKVLIKNNSIKNNILVFYCRHLFHQGCLPSLDAVEKCIICCSQKSE